MPESPACMHVVYTLANENVARMAKQSSNKRRKAKLLPLRLEDRVLRATDVVIRWLGRKLGVIAGKRAPTGGLGLAFEFADFMGGQRAFIGLQAAYSANTGRGALYWCSENCYSSNLISRAGDSRKTCSAHSLHLRTKSGALQLSCSFGKLRVEKLEQHLVVVA